MPNQTLPLRQPLNKKYGGGRRINVPPERAHGWAEPTEAPIVDAARVPLQAFRENKPARSAYLMYAWLHIVRPFLFILFCLGIAFYAWHHVVSPTEDLNDVELLGIYAAVVAVILVVMLLVAPFRWMRQRDEDDRNETPANSTVFELAKFADVPPRRLASWRNLRRSIVRHDNDGNVRSAESLEGHGTPAVTPQADISKKTS